MPDPTYYTSPVLAPPKPSTTGAYEDSITGAFSDYTGLQQSYKDLLDRIRGNPSKMLTYNPVNYTQSGDVTSSMSNLSDLSQNGGYSDQNIADLRARGIAPIRSVYASAQRELSRSRGLNGGYSPNFAAISAKMARDQASLIAGQETNVNAGIAEDQAKGRLAIAPTYASAASNEEGRKLSVDQANESNRENVESANNSNRTSQFSNELGVLDAMKSLYGTTPALASTFGSQALGAAGINAGNARAGAPMQPRAAGSVSRNYGSVTNPLLARY